MLRPEPGLSETVAMARGMGLDPVAAPLFVVAPVPWEGPDPAVFDAIVAGSANAFRHGGAQLTALTTLPVHAVGERTADAARATGFAVASVGAGGLQELIDHLPGSLRLLRLAGARRTVLRARPGLELVEREVYRADPQPLPASAIAALRGGAVALLHSGEAARHFAGECDRLAIDRSRVTLAALAPRIAEAAGTGWAAVASSTRPSDAALLAMAADMCQTARQQGRTPRGSRNGT
jgi:uroporphyrinogen-III synthase